MWFLKDGILKKKKKRSKEREIEAKAWNSEHQIEEKLSWETLKK